MTDLRQLLIRSLAEEIGPVRAVISLEDDIAQSMEQAWILADFLDRLSAPTQAQQWLEQAAEQLRKEREGN